MKPAVSTKRKPGECRSLWKPNRSPDNQRSNRKIKEKQKKKKHPERNENGSVPHLRAAAKAVPRGQLVAVSPSIQGQRAQTTRTHLKNVAESKSARG